MTHSPSCNLTARFKVRHKNSRRRRVFTDTVLCEFVELVFLRPAQTRKHCCGSKNASRTQKMFLENFKKHFFLPRHRFCVFNICCAGEQTRNLLGNTQETLTLNVSRMFPRLRTQATYLEDAEFVSRKQKCFASLPFAPHPYNIVTNIDSKCFCGNVYSFAPTFMELSMQQVSTKSIP